VDHGGLAGLADDDHTQYIKHSLATAASDFLVASGVGAFIKKTLAEVKAILGFSEWTDVAYNSGNFTASGSMTWTVASGDVILYRYKMLSSDTMLLQWRIIQSSVGGTPDTNLMLAIPNSRTASGDGQSCLCYVKNAASVSVGLVYVVVTEGAIRIYKDLTAVSNYSASTDTTDTLGEIFLKVA
jgi:hypothetical protein